MSRNKRILAFALAVFFFFMFSLGPMHQKAKAIAFVDDALIAIVIAALAAIGITFTAAGSFGDITEYVRGLMEEYAGTRGLTITQLFDGVQTGSNRFGNILMNNRFVILIDTFAAWLISKFNLVDNSTQALVTPGASINGLNLYRLPIVLRGNGVMGRGVMVLQSEEDVFAVFGIGGANNDELYTNVISDGEALIRRFYVENDGSYSGTYDGYLEYKDEYGLYYGGGYLLVARYFMDNPFTFYSQNTVLEALRQHGIAVTSKQIDVSTGVIELPSDNPAYPQYPGAILEIGGAGWGESYDDIVDVQIPVGYADSSIVYEGEEEVAEQVEDTPAQSISQNASDYQVNGLTGVFPFCIPFDIYSFFECLAADPVAPHFVWRFYVPGICDESIDLDLAPFDSVAQIVRTMELLAFIVGLAIVTRNRFLRG